MLDGKRDGTTLYGSRVLESNTPGHNPSSTVQEYKANHIAMTSQETKGIGRISARGDVFICTGWLA